MIVGMGAAGRICYLGTGEDRGKSRASDTGQENLWEGAERPR